MAYIRSGNESIPATSHRLFNLVLKGSNMSWDSLVTTVERSKHTFTFLERNSMNALGEDGKKVYWSPSVW